MNKHPDQAPNASNGGEKVPESGSHEDFGPTETNAPGSDKNKPFRKEETGATEAGNEDKGAKM